MFRLLLLVLLALPWVAQGAYTAAWKVPLETLVPDQARKEKIRKLEKPPGESAFFAPGDELWDVSGVLRDVNLLPMYADRDSFGAQVAESPGAWKGEWAVWNARTGRLVARGGFPDLLKAQLAWEFKGEPAKIGYQLEWMRPGEAKPFQSISAVCGDGESLKKNEGNISLTAEPSLELSSGQKIDIGLAVSWKANGEDEGWEVGTSLKIPDGGKVLVAKHGSGAKAWELILFCKKVEVDGTEARLLQTKGRDIEVWAGDTFHAPVPPKVALPGNRSITWHQIPPVGVSLPLPMPKYDLEVPEPLRPWIDGPLVGIPKEIFREKGIDTNAPDFFVAMDPVAQLLVAAASDETQPLIAELVDSVVGQAERSLFIEIKSAAGNSGLVVDSGAKAAIWKRGRELEQAVFEVEAERREEGIGLLLGMRMGTGNAKDDFLETRLVLIPDQWQKVLEAKSGESEDTQVSVRATATGP